MLNATNRKKLALALRQTGRDKVTEEQMEKAALDLIEGKKGRHELAEALGIDEQDYMAFEIGAEEPSPDQLARIARLCGTTVDRLHGAPMPTSPWADRMAATGRLTSAEVWGVAPVRRVPAQRPRPCRP